MQRIIVFVLMGLLSAGAMATSGGVKLQRANVDLNNRASLQNGARLFVNYCVSCHSASFMRYNRIAADLGIPDELMMRNLMFTTDKIGEPMTVAMRPTDAEKWFGIPPPDLSVIARARGVDWLYSFLQGFYVDPTRPTGMNNLYLPGASMPHVLWELQGLQKPIFHTVKDENGTEIKAIERLELVTPGKLSEAEFKKSARDLVTFLEYLGEPAKLVRYKLGVAVLLFLSVLLVAVYFMKREYWKDVH